jgi:hypothetical protein
VDSRETSDPSCLDFGVESLQFCTGVFDAELPIDTALFGVCLAGPDCNFNLQLSQFIDAAVTQTLGHQATQLTFGDIQQASYRVSACCRI